MKILRTCLLCTLVFLSLACGLLSTPKTYESPAFSFTYPRWPQYRPGRDY